MAAVEEGEDQAPGLVLRVDEWELYADQSSGKIYFFNVETNATQWDPPEQLQTNPEVCHFVAEEEDGAGEAEDTQIGEDVMTTQQTSETYEEDGSSPMEGMNDAGSGADDQEAVSGRNLAEDGEEEEGEWGEAVDAGSGKVYYFNRYDGRTTWDVPEGYQPSTIAMEGEEHKLEKSGDRPEEEVLEEGELDEEEEEEEEDGMLSQGHLAKEHWTRGTAADEKMSQGSASRSPSMGHVDREDKAEAIDGSALEMAAASDTTATRFSAGERPVVGPAGATAAAGGSGRGGDASESDSPRAMSSAAPSISKEEFVATASKHDTKEVPQPLSHEVKVEDDRSQREVAKYNEKEEHQQGEIQGKRKGDEFPKGAAVKGMKKARSGRVALEQAKRRLEADDSIMDPGIVGAVLTYINEHSRSVEAGETTDNVDLVDLLASTYKGYANMSILLATWLQNLSGDGTEQDLDATELILDHLNGQVKNNFDLEKADALLFGKKQDMTFIDDMMQYKRWRRLLMEIFAEHKESKLLGGYCMQHMSRAGHNTEMADIISVTDYWSVARGVLTELLAEVPWADHIHLWHLLTNLKLICCSTAYLHAFSQEVLRHLEATLLRQAATMSDDDLMAIDGDDDECTKVQSVIASARKYRRIREELEKASWEEAANYDRHRSHFVHKLSAWQKQPREEELLISHSSEESERRRRLVEMLFTVFSDRGLSDRSLSLLQEMYVDKALFTEREEKEETAFGMEDDEDDEEEVVKIKGPLEYLLHPQLLDLLVQAIFDPKKRLSTDDQRREACKILAVASSALLDGTVDKDEADALCKNLHLSSDLLADEETLRWSMSTSSTPSILKAYLRQPVIAMGFLHWLRATIQDPEFHNSRQFNEVMQVFMRLLQFLVIERPLHQPAVFAALKAVLNLMPTESSFNIIKMKRQALQCCVFLMSHGFVLPVVSFLRSIIRDMDHALIRHFVGLSLVAAQPPYSSLFANAMSSFLREVVVSKALRSNMEENHKRALATFVEECSKESNTMLEPQVKKGLKALYGMATTSKKGQ